MGVLSLHSLDPLDGLLARLRRADFDTDVDRVAVYLGLHADFDLALEHSWNLAPHHRRGRRPVFTNGLNEQGDQFLKFVGASGHTRNVPLDEDRSTGFAL
jgi:hypothetical protein